MRKTKRLAYIDDFINLINYIKTKMSFCYSPDLWFNEYISPKYFWQALELRDFGKLVFRNSETFLNHECPAGWWLYHFPVEVKGRRAERDEIKGLLGQFLNIYWLLTRKKTNYELLWSWYTSLEDVCSRRYQKEMRVSQWKSYAVNMFYR